MQDALGAAALGSDTDPDLPYAYLNYLLFDESFNLVDGGAKQVGGAGGFDTGDELAYNFDHLTFG